MLGEGTGYFRTAKESGRWWLADPDAFAFWASGLDCVRLDCEARCGGLESALYWLPAATAEFAGIFRTSERTRLSGKFINHLAANLIRSFGPHGWRGRWATIALEELKRLRFNPVGNCSDREHASKAHFPYVRPMSSRGSRTSMIYRDFLDVFAPGFQQDAAGYASPLRSTAGDPAFIGLFLMNEPTTGFSVELPAAELLFTADSCATRDEPAPWLRAKYDGDRKLASVWNMPVGFERDARGRFSGILHPEALNALCEFSRLRVERYFKLLCGATRKADPNHLNPGMRRADIPLAAGGGGDEVPQRIQPELHRGKLPFDPARNIHEMLEMPVLAGAWRCGAPDAGPPAPGNRPSAQSGGRAREGLPGVPGGRGGESLVCKGALVHAVRSVGARPVRWRELQDRLPRHLQQAV
jgi:hypothetical protein